MTDRIELRGLRAHGRHGVFEAERRDGQPFVVDLVVEVDVAAAAASDDLQDTVDYAALARLAHDAVTGAPVALIETLAQRIATGCLELDGRIEAIEVSVHKPQAPVGLPLDDVVVHLRRSRG